MSEQTETVQMVEALVLDDLINGQHRIMKSDKPQLVPAAVVAKYPSKFVIDGELELDDPELDDPELDETDAGDEVPTEGDEEE